ncbi:hypothetical protein M9458_028617, partial [Cirrhinus mrigala]
DPHYLSREIIQHLKQQDGEIHMDPIQDFNGAQRATFPEDPMSSDPTLMFSQPHS